MNDNNGWGRIEECVDENGQEVRDYYPQRATPANQTTQRRTTPRRKHTRHNVALTQKLIKAINLRMKGYTYQAIADECGYKSRAAAYNAIHDELSHYTEQSIEEWRNEALAQLDEIQRKLWDEAMTGGRKGKIDQWALDRLLAVMEKRARLLGLYPKEGNSAPPVVVFRTFPQEVLDAI